MIIHTQKVMPLQNNGRTKEGVTLTWPSKEIAIAVFKLKTSGARIEFNALLFAGGAAAAGVVWSCEWSDGWLDGCMGGQKRGGKLPSQEKRR